MLKNKVIFSALIFVLISAVIVYPRDKEIPKINISSGVNPAPFPFQEMTIPYLRARTYQSSLREMQYD